MSAQSYRKVVRVLATSVWTLAIALGGLRAQDTPQAGDPFADVTEAKPATTEHNQSWIRRFLTDNLGFRKEVMSQFDTTGDGNGASRQSLGFEVLKKFSTATSTVASFDFQGRLVRRDGYAPVMNDMEGADRAGWAFEYHNVYLDLYNVAGGVGHFNIRAGRFYVPFGLNIQTDTHGTVLQLSNEADFGFERDWQAGLWGTLNRHLVYNASYLTGSGYDLRYRGQTGLAAVRIGLSEKYSSEYGLEAGVSAIGGQRLAEGAPLGTSRIGLDARYRHAAPRGLLTFTTELSGGRDARDRVIADLNQAEYLSASRRWGLASQFRRFSREGVGTVSSIAGEFTWYFRNDVAGSNSHWIKLNVERQLANVMAPTHTVVTLQYYFYR